ncbi:hypothetical protein BD324DRAFT_649067 [Kockovaella imperatae]|uniref:Kinase n=1 Tax=Kockovaella imperatae TaxID=4999 RepID=A0A1Y1ULU3_9TREE|nr:hypothetical protein BD324DRAFT_649067 [Kockovaella imperatae]ORX38969.1 hypothetical protein BD324DRAFT_649067 [Kockovaella imperatae]
MPSPDLSLYHGSTPLANKVAGHQNVMSDESGSLVIKPALPREIAFYHMLGSAPRSSALAQLKPFVAQFYGTLRLEGQLDGLGGISKEGIKVGEVPESIVLENLAHNYTRPCVLDAKLGTELHAPDASEEKRARMEKQARETTSHATGLRLTGCQIWHAPTSSYILTPKSYGKSLTPSSLPAGIIRFFPLPTDKLASLVLPLSPSSDNASTPSTGGGVSHLPLTPADPASLEKLTAPGPSGSSEKVPGPDSPTEPVEYTSHAIPPALLLRLLSAIDGKMAELEHVISRLEARFIGASALLVYEGDPERLEDALNRYDERQKALSVAAQGRGPGQSVKDADLEGDDEEEEEEEEEEDDELEDDYDSSTSSDDDSQDGQRADARRARRCPPFTLKMIDFAHTRLVQGEGRDEGVLLGLRTLRGLIQGRIGQVNADMGRQGASP